MCSFCFIPNGILLGEMRPLLYGLMNAKNYSQAQSPIPSMFPIRAHPTSTPTQMSTEDLRNGPEARLGSKTHNFDLECGGRSCFSATPGAQLMHFYITYEHCTIKFLICTKVRCNISSHFGDVLKSMNWRARFERFTYEGRNNGVRPFTEHVVSCVDQGIDQQFCLSSESSILSSSK